MPDCRVAFASSLAPLGLGVCLGLLLVAAPARAQVGDPTGGYSLQGAPNLGGVSAPARFREAPAAAARRPARRAESTQRRRAAQHAAPDAGSHPGTLRRNQPWRCHRRSGRDITRRRRERPERAWTHPGAGFRRSGTQRYHLPPAVERCRAGFGRSDSRAACRGSSHRAKGRKPQISLRRIRTPKPTSLACG